MATQGDRTDQLVQTSNRLVVAVSNLKVRADLLTAGVAATIGLVGVVLGLTVWLLTIANQHSSDLGKLAALPEQAKGAEDDIKAVKGDLARQSTDIAVIKSILERQFPAKPPIQPPQGDGASPR